MPDVSIVIVNFNSGEHLGTCLAGLRHHLHGHRWEAMVIDNASSDGSESAAEAIDQRVRLWRNERNVGFAAAVNHGAALTTGRSLLLLNPDCVVSRDLVGVLSVALRGDERCAVAGPRILDPDGTVQGSARGDPTMLTGMFGRTTLMTKLLPGSALARRNVRTGARDEDFATREVDWVSGACMLIRREAFDEVGGFDPGYFLYWEDADFCRRLRRAGWTIRYVPAASVTHAVGVSSRSARRLAIAEFHRSAYRYYRLHVARQRWDPRRWIAKGLLTVRCRLKLMNAGSGT